MRAQESQKLLNWGFQFTDAIKLYDRQQTVKEIEIWKGDKRRLKAGFRQDFVVTVPKGHGERLKAELLAMQPLVAPVAEGQRVGSLRLTLDGKAFGEFPVVALEAAAPAGLLGRAWDTLRLWLQ
jgi:D-alanyl-D-alanine carboxypeptidase (penicillin-binding protein 5/6)